MITVIFHGTSGKVSHGIVIGRSGHMLEVAFDVTEYSPAGIWWVNPSTQIGKMTVSSQSFEIRHRALKEIASGNIERGRQILTEEDRQRQLERLENQK